MITPQGQLNELADLVVASSTFEDGNMGKSSLTDQKLVVENRQKFFQLLEIDPSKVGKIIVATNNQVKLVNQFESVIKNFDGIVTNKKNFYFSMLTADCIPLVLFDSKKRVLGFIHLGWRGVVKKSVAKTVDLMVNQLGSNPADIFAYLAPAISRKAYKQKGIKVWLKALVFILSGNKKSVQKLGGYFYFDIKKSVRDQLIRKEVPQSQIETSPHCTYLEKDLFPSYVREGQKRQSGMLTVIGLRS